MGENILFGLSLILFLGISAQWLAWRIRVPSIVILLLFGFLAGPILGILDTEALFGNLLFPVISLLVSVIVFEGGLSLKIADLKGMGGSLNRLIILGTLFTFLIIAWASIYVLKLPVDIAWLFAAMMVITGPTVIVPMLRHVKLKRSFGSLMRWEGILIAPVGTLVIILVYQYFFEVNTNTVDLFLSLFKVLAIGGGMGVFGGLLTLLKIRRDWAPDSLQEAISLMLVVSVYTGANMFQSGAGLVAVIVMGIAIANQRFAVVQHILDFKENLRVLAISSLFILLSSTVQLDSLLMQLNKNSILFLLILIFIARPVPVLLSTIGTSLSFRERLFLSWMAPRGIVTASIASLFALELVAKGVPGADSLVPLSFLVIIVTVTLYGFTAEHVQRFLKLSKDNQDGVLLLGAGTFSRALAKLLQSHGIYVELIDSNRESVMQCRNEKLPVYHSNIFSNRILEELELSGIGKMLSLSSSDEVNMLASLQYSDVLGKENVYRLLPESNTLYKEELLKKIEQARYLFKKGISYSFLSSKIHSGSELSVYELDEKASMDDLEKRFPSQTIVLFLIRGKQFIPLQVEKEMAFKKNDKLIILS